MHAPLTPWWRLANVRLAFKTLEDQKAFEESDIVKEGAKKYAEKAGPPAHATFEVEAFPDHASPSPLVSFNRIIISDPSKGLAAKAAWEKVTAVLGKKAFGGKAVGDGPSVGLALLGWDSTEVSDERDDAPLAVRRPLTDLLHRNSPPPRRSPSSRLRGKSTRLAAMSTALWSS